LPISPYAHLLLANLEDRVHAPSWVVLVGAEGVDPYGELLACGDGESEEVREAEEEPRSFPTAIGLTLVGLVVIAVGGELVTEGAEGIVSVLGLSTLLVGMVVTPAAIEIEEVIRQAVPAREGRPEVSAGNLVGTLLYFLWFNLGLIALLFPVQADPLIVRLDWPYLVGVTWLATLFFARGRVGRVEGMLLVALYCVYVLLHVALG
jgi:cation:H+ antiporter